MKKLLIYTLLSFILFSACKKDNDNLIDGKTPEERVNEAVTQYSETITSSPYGWKAVLYPSGGGGYSFFMTFNKQNRVTMYCDFTESDNGPGMESSYRLKANQIPSLLFDTYNFMHVIADPDPNQNGGEPGIGLQSDFEFSFDKMAGDSIKMTGKLFESKFIMVRATKEEMEQYQAGALTTLVSDVDAYVNSSPFLYVLLGDENKIQTTFNANSKVFTLTWNEAGVVSTISSAYSYTLTGVHLEHPLVYKGKSVSDFTFDPETGGLYTTIDGVKIVVMASATPILPLHTVIGINYNNIVVPNATNYPGWSANFVARRRAVATATLNSGYGLRLDRMVFAFNTEAKTMNLNVDIYQGANGFLGVWPYSYTKTSDGVYKFTARTVTGNASLIVNEMAPITLQRINVDQFVLDYFVNPSNGQILGQFKSVEHPDFTFSGVLQ